MFNWLNYLFGKSLFSAIYLFGKFRFSLIYLFGKCHFWRFICLDNFISLSLSLKYNNLQITMYYKRIIDKYLSEWASRDTHKPILLRGARQVGKSSAVRHLGKQFKTFLEINFEMEPQYKAIFQPDLNVNRIVLQISAISGSRIEEGETLQAQTYILIFGNVASYFLPTRT